MVPSQLVFMPRSVPAPEIDRRPMRVDPTEPGAETVPPSSPPVSDFPGASPIPPMPVDPAKMTLEQLETEYASRQWRREPFEVESARTANIPTEKPTADLIAADLTAMDEAKLTTGVFSGPLQNSPTKKQSDREE